jgi:hypothetical protein
LSDRHAVDQRRAIWPPEPGCFRIRLAPRAWLVPCKIVHDDDGWHAIIDEREHDPHPDPAHAPRVSDVWTGLRISESEYDWLIAVKRQAERTDPSHPSLNPTTAIHPNRLQPLIPRDTVL